MKKQPKVTDTVALEIDPDYFVIRRRRGLGYTLEIPADFAETLGLKFGMKYKETLVDGVRQRGWRQGWITHKGVQL